LLLFIRPDLGNLAGDCPGKLSNVRKRHTFSFFAFFAFFRHLDVLIKRLLVVERIIIKTKV